MEKARESAAKSTLEELENTELEVSEGGGGERGATVSRFPMISRRSEKVRHHCEMGDRRENMIGQVKLG